VVLGAGPEGVVLLIEAKLAAQWNAAEPLIEQ